MEREREREAALPLSPSPSVSCLVNNPMDLIAIPWGDVPGELWSRRDIYVVLII